MAAMNVCLISREYPPFFGGGIGTYTVQWARTLVAGGHRAIVVTVSGDGKERREQAGGVTVVRLPFIKDGEWSGPHQLISTPETRAAFAAFAPVSVFAMQVEAAMPRLVREFSIDIIEAPDTGALAWFGLNSRRTGGAWKDLPPVVTVVHSPTEWISEQNRTPLRGRADLELVQMERDSVRWSEGLVCPSAYLADWGARHWGLARESIQTVPYPLGDLEGVAKASRERAARRDGTDSFIMLYAGRLEPRKGIDTLIEGFALATKKLRGLHLDLAGEDMPDPAGPGQFGQNSLKARVPEELREQVRLLGRQTPEQLGSLREKCDAVVIPSAADNFPFSCVEAMAEGRVVIASAGGGTGEMIRSGVDGVLFEAGNAESCATSILRAAAMTGEERMALSRSAAARILALCGNEAVVSKRVAHFECVMKRRKPREERSLEVAVVNASAGSESAVGRLEDAVRRGNDVDFAHGWVRTPDGETHVWGTPDVLTLGLGSRVIGPMVITQEAALHPSVVQLLRRESGGLRTDSTWTLAVALALAGLNGAVVPGAVFEVADSQRHPVDQPGVKKLTETQAARERLERELRTIHESRGWWFLQRVYAVLHVLRGRGRRGRDYYQ
jgi:glycosyltransferase involved in cell wall biosynthesis